MTKFDESHFMYALAAGLVLQGVLVLVMYFQFNMLAIPLVVIGCSIGFMALGFAYMYISDNIIPPSFFLLLVILPFMAYMIAIVPMFVDHCEYEHQVKTFNHSNQTMRAWAGVLVKTSDDLHAALTERIDAGNLNATNHTFGYYHVTCPDVSFLTKFPPGPMVIVNLMTSLVLPLYMALFLTKLLPDLLELKIAQHLESIRGLVLDVLDVCNFVSLVFHPALFFYVKHESKGWLYATLAVYAIAYSSTALGLATYFHKAKQNQDKADNIDEQGYAIDEEDTERVQLCDSLRSMLFLELPLLGMRLTATLVFGLTPMVFMAKNVVCAIDDGAIIVNCGNRNNKVNQLVDQMVGMIPGAKGGQLDERALMEQLDDDTMRMEDQKKAYDKMEKKMLAKKQRLDDRERDLKVLRSALKAGLHKSDYDDSDMHKAFNNYDKDGNGVISKNELRDLFSGLFGGDVDDYELEELIKEADTDGDDQIDFAEFVKMMRDMEDFEL